jgi:hypothetical protein
MLGIGSRSKTRGENSLRLSWSTYIRRGGEGSQKPFSSLSEGVRRVFTISTDSSEMTCTPLHILQATPMSSWVTGASCSHERACSVCRETVSRLKHAAHTNFF